MPLRDHFRSPVNDRHSWDSLHGGWPMMIVRDLFEILPPGYEAKPNIHLGPMFEIDVSTFESDGPANVALSLIDGDGGGVATAVAPNPTLTLEAELPEVDEYEVRIYDEKHGRELVAAIEIVSPSNKDRPDSRRVFVDKLAALLKKDVCVSVIDLVTSKHFNLYGDLLRLIGRSDPVLSPEVPYIYAVTMRTRKPYRRPAQIDFWFYPLEVGQPLPTLPIWLNHDLRVLLPLETSYEETCRLLHIG